MSKLDVGCTLRGVFECSLATRGEATVEVGRHLFFDVD